MESVVLHLLFELSRFTALAFVSGLWQGFAMISAVALCFRILPRVGASIRFALWGLVFALLATIPMVHFSAATLPQPHVPHAAVHIGVGWGAAVRRSLGCADGLAYRSTPDAGSSPGRYLAPGHAGPRPGRCSCNACKWQTESSALHVGRRGRSQCDWLSIASAPDPGMDVCEAYIAGVAASCAA